MSAGTPHGLTHSQWKRNMSDTTILDRDTEGRSKRNGDTNDIKCVEFLVTRRYYLSAIKVFQSCDEVTIM